MKPITKAILPVAGLGTRFLPATKAIPKEMLPIIDKPLLQYAVEEAVEIGVKEIIFITSHTKKAIENHFSSSPDLEASLKRNGKNEFLKAINPEQLREVKFTFIDQEEQKGLGHAVSLANEALNEDDDAVAILLPDDLFISTTPCPIINFNIDSKTTNSKEKLKTNLEQILREEYFTPAIKRQLDNVITIIIEAKKNKLSKYIK